MLCEQTVATKKFGRSIDDIKIYNLWKMMYGLRIQVTCCGYMEETINCNGNGVQRKIRENLMKMMAFVLGIMNKVSKSGD